MRVVLLPHSTRDQAILILKNMVKEYFTATILPQFCAVGKEKRNWHIYFELPTKKSGSLIIRQQYPITIRSPVVCFRLACSLPQIKKSGISTAETLKCPFLAIWRLLTLMTHANLSMSNLRFNFTMYVEALSA